LLPLSPPILLGLAFYRWRFRIFDLHPCGKRCSKVMPPASTRKRSNLALWLRNVFQSVVVLPSAHLYPALAYGIDNDGIGRANFIGVGNRGPSGIVYHFKVTCGRSKAKAE